jgi:UDP-N-acetylmuramate dehydrogenase
MLVREFVSLQPFNTFGLAARARYFAEVYSVDDLRALLHDPAYRDLPRLLLGGGSNILLTGDFPGLVIHIAIGGIEVVQEDEAHVWVRAGAGVSWHALVEYALANQFAGLENLSLIPGSVGASPMQNIGAYGVEIKDVFAELDALHLETGTLRTVGPEACRFGYRESVFKHEWKGQYAITSVTFRLDRVPTLRTGYGDIQKTLAERGVTQPNIRDISAAVIQIRRSKLPDPAELGNAGSFFKNPEIPEAQFAALREQYPTVPGYPTTPGCVKVPAGWLIEQSGWKGKRLGNAGMHARQALVLVNYGGATGEELLDVARQVQASVEAQFGIRLSAEVNVV